MSSTSGLKERKSLQLTTFLGLDKVHTPYKVDSRRASEMSNFIMRDGTVRKRNGWETKTHFLNKDILCIYPFTELIQSNGTTIKKQRFLMFYTKGDRLLYCDRLDSDFIVLSTIINGINWGGNKPQVFFKNNMAYILTGYEYYVYGRMTDDNIYNYGLRKVYNDSMTYIPTTTIGIEKDENGAEGNRKALDEVNLLTQYRYNTIIGSTRETTYTLDGTPDINSTMYVYVNDETMSSTVNSGTTIIKDSNGNDTFEYNMSTKKFQIVADGYSTLVAGEPNIKVKFKCSSSHTHIDSSVYPDYIMVDYSSFGVLFGTSNETSRLFISGNIHHKNMELYSAYNDFTYFPDINYRYVGSDTYAITGYSRLNDSTLCVFKEENPQEPTVWYRTASYDNETTQFYDVSGTLGETAIGNNCNVNFYGDSIILTKNGLFGVVQTSNYQTNQRYAIERTELISPVFKSMDLNKSCIGIYGDNLYFTCDGETYVCDRKYNSKTSQSSYNYYYEWWKLDGIDATCYMTYGGKLYFGTSDGKIKVFYDGFQDVDFTKYGDTLTIDNKKIHTSLALYNTLKVGDKVKLSFDVKVSVCTSFGTRNKEVISGGILYVAKKEQDGTHNYISLKCYEEGDAGEIIDYSVSNSQVLQVINYKNIDSIWVTPLTDFGSTMASKTLLGITISAEQMLNGKLSFGYQTTKEITSFEQKGLQVYDRDGIDYSYYSFATDFQNSYSKKTNIRNFNFIRFKIISESNGDFSIQTISFLYKYNKKNRGIR